jgi:ParB family chromosome partitioning protein
MLELAIKKNGEKKMSKQAQTPTKYNPYTVNITKASLAGIRANSCIIRSVPVDMVSVCEGRRACDAEQVRMIANSIKKVGLIHPITVTKQASKLGFVNLVAGRHRLEAMKLLGWTHIDAIIVGPDLTKNRLREIAENLFRNELSVLERAELVAEWTTLSGQKVVQVAQPGGRQPKDQGISKAANELNLTREEVRRSKLVAGIFEEAKEAAKVEQISDNQKALLEVAKQPTAEAQVEKVYELAARARAPRHKQSTNFGAAASKLLKVTTPSIADTAGQHLKTIRRSEVSAETLPKGIFILSGTTADADTLEYIDDPQFAAEVQTFIRECRERRNAGDGEAAIKKLAALASPSVVPTCR